MRRPGAGILSPRPGRPATACRADSARSARRPAACFDDRRSATHHLRRHEDSRVSGQGDPRAVRRPGAARRDGDDGGGRGRDRAQARRRRAVVKAQIHAGGRGKGGGVKVVKSAEEAEKVAAQILGMQLVTHQTGPAGPEGRRACSSRRGWQIARELYFGMLIDRATQCPVLMASSDGGVDIEEVAEKTPDLHLQGVRRSRRRPAPPSRRASSPSARPRGRAGRQGRQADAGALPGASSAPTPRSSRSTRSSSPSDGDLLALDAKMTFDDNALYPPPGLQGRCATSTKRIRSRSRRRSSR